MATAEEIHKKGRRAAPARMGLATNLIQVQLEYNRWQSSTGPNRAAIERKINWVLATYSTKTHHKCFTFVAGFDDACVKDIVSDIIAVQLQACTDADPDDVGSCRAAAIAAAKSKIVAIKGCGLLGTLDKGGEEVCADPVAADKATIAANTMAVDTVNAAIAKIQAARAKELTDIFQQEVALNNTLAAAAAGRKAATDKRVTEATLAALKVGDGELDAALAAAKTKQDLAKDTLDSARNALGRCAKKWPSPMAIHANCTAVANKFYQAEQDLAAAEATATTLQTKKASKSLSAAEQAQKVKELELASKNLASNQADKQALVTKIEKELVDNNCDVSKTYDARSVCGKLFAELEQARSELEKIQAELDRLRNQLETQKTLASEKADEESASKDDGSMTAVIIAVCVTLVICLMVMGAVVAVLMGGKGGDGGVAAKPRAGNTVTAFANPMYADPAIDGSASYGGGGTVKTIDMGDSANDEMNDGLYDEPAYNGGAAAADSVVDEATYAEAGDAPPDAAMYEDVQTTDNLPDLADDVPPEGGYLDVTTDENGDDGLDSDSDADM